MSKTMIGVTITLGALVILLMIALVMLFQGGPSQRQAIQEITYSQFLHSQKDVRDATIRGNELSGRLADNRSFTTRLPADPSIATKLADAGASVTIGLPDDPSTSLTSVIISVLSLAISLLWLVPLFRIARALERGATPIGRAAEPKG